MTVIGQANFTLHDYESMQNRINALEAQNAELLDALVQARAEHQCDWNGCWCSLADAAIAKAKGITQG
jgi:hypothetical protein